MSHRTSAALPKLLDIENFPNLGVDETVHAVTQSEDPEQEVSEFPYLIMVQCEDDLTRNKHALLMRIV